MKLTINVTQAHIDKALATTFPGANINCPIYQAIQDEPLLKGQFTVGIAALQHLCDNAQNISLPEEAEEFSRNAYFERYELLKPLSFEIELDDESIS